MFEQHYVYIDVIAVPYAIDFIHEITVCDCLVLIIGRVACVVLVFSQLCRGEITVDCPHFMPYVAITENYIRIIAYKRIKRAQYRHDFLYKTHKVPSPS